MSDLEPKPPRFALWLLGLIYQRTLFDEISGDLLELYIDRCKRRGKLRAGLQYMIDVILSMRNIGLGRKSGSDRRASMLYSYIEMTFRSIRGRRVYAALNIFGLALGMAACIFIVQYVKREKDYDHFHANYRDIYRVTYSYRYFSDGARVNCAAAPPRIAPFMKEVMPEVKSFARVHPVPGIVISYKDLKFRQDKALMVEPDFLKIFTFPMIEGDINTALNDLTTIVLTETSARKYFGTESPLGKVMAVDGVEHYKVTGVVKDVPATSHLQFDFLISYKTIINWTEGQAEDSWWHDDYYNYVQLESNTSVDDFEQRFSTLFMKERGKENLSENMEQNYHLQSISDIHLYSKLDKEAEPQDQGDANAILFLSLIAVFILLIAWVNYINLSTARSIERAREVGVRKSLGATYRQLIMQFLIESVVMNLIAFVVSISFVFFGIRYFNLTTGTLLTLDFFADPKFWIQAFGVLMIGSIASGLYPAFVLSSFRPALVLKGRASVSRSGILLRRSLVVFQFAASVTLIAGTLIVYQQLSFMRSSELGFDMNEVMVIRGPGVREDELDSTRLKLNSTFVHELENIPGVINVTGGSSVPGREIPGMVVIKKREDDEASFKTVQSVWIGDNYFNTLNIKLLAGRSFSEDFKSDSMAVVLNASAARLLGFSSPEDAIGKMVSVGIVQSWPVIGIVDDYKQMSVQHDVRPIFFHYYSGYGVFYTIRSSQSKYQFVAVKAKQLYESFYPRDPFDYFFLDEFFNRQYHNEQKFSHVFTLFASFAIFVACLGLFGLSSFNALQRTKEIGIRKVLGAEVSNILYLLSKEFFALVLIANIIAWPIIYLVMEDWLSNFATRIHINAIYFFSSGLIVFCVAVIAVGYKTIITARSNPVKALVAE